MNQVIEFRLKDPTLSEREIDHYACWYYPIAQLERMDRLMGLAKAFNPTWKIVEKVDR